jgi:hypothetical protein
MRVFAVLLTCCAALAGAGCGSSSDSSQEADQARAEERERIEAAESEDAEAETNECDPNYSGACLDPYASDYDCAGGSGDGPEYTGPVTVVGEDRYGLDSDGDGYACES